MNESLPELNEKYASCPASQKEYAVNGKRYTVVRIFTGDKNINSIVYRLAVSSADREAEII